MDALAADAIDLLQFLHQVELGVQPAGGVDKQQVEATGAAARMPS
jgi:hypothetical protein